MPHPDAACVMQEMGDVGEGADVVDEQLWGDQAGEEAPGQEKFEKDAPVQVGQLQGMHS